MLQVLIFEFLMFRIFEILILLMFYCLFTQLGKSELVHCPVDHFTLCIQMEFSIKYFKVKSGWSIVYIEVAHIIISK